MAKEEEKEVPGQHLKESAQGFQSALAYWLILCLGVGIAVGNSKVASSENKAVCLGMVLASGAGLILAALASGKWLKAFGFLGERWKESQRDLEGARKGYYSALEQVNDYVAFIGAFRPSQEQVDAILEEGALKVRGAREEHEKFYRRGLQISDDAPMTCHKDQAISESEERFLARCAQLKNSAHYFETLFGQLCEPAKKRGYSVKTWQEYAGIVPYPTSPE